MGRSQTMTAPSLSSVLDFVQAAVPSLGHLNQRRAEIEMPMAQLEGGELFVASFSTTVGPPRSDRQSSGTFQQTRGDPFETLLSATERFTMGLTERQKGDSDASLRDLDALLKDCNKLVDDWHEEEFKETEAFYARVEALLYWVEEATYPLVERIEAIVAYVKEAACSYKDQYRSGPRPEDTRAVNLDWTRRALKAKYAQKDINAYQFEVVKTLSARVDECVDLLRDVVDGMWTVDDSCEWH